MIIIGK